MNIIKFDHAQNKTQNLMPVKCFESKIRKKMYQQIIVTLRYLVCITLLNWFTFCYEICQNKLWAITYCSIQNKIKTYEIEIYFNKTSIQLNRTNIDIIMLYFKLIYTSPKIVQHEVGI